MTDIKRFITNLLKDEKINTIDGGKVMLVAPSILSADFGNMAQAVKNIQADGADIVHCDVMDGVYVPNITFGMPMVKAVKNATSLPVDAHLMITKPEKYVGAFCDAGADIVTFHPEASDNVQDALDTIVTKGKKCGLAVNADIDFDIVLPYLDKIDLLIIMTVQAGFGGQSFKSECLDKVRRADDLRKRFGYKYLIEADGGICESNALECKNAGVDIAVAGSAVFKSDNPQRTISAIKNCR